MSFERTDYLSWYLPRVFRGGEVVHLDASGVPSLGPDDVAVPDGDPWQMSCRFEEALAAWLGIGAPEVVFTPGGTGGTLLALLTLVAPGGEIVVEEPIYEPMLRQAERAGRVRRLVRRQDDQWRLPLAAADRLIRESTALVVVTEPHNPSGRLTPREDVLALARIAQDRGALVLINEVYRGFSDAPSYHGAAANIVVVSSLSKLMGAYWARLGWLSATRALADRLRQAHLNLGMAAAPNAAVGLGVLERADELRARAVRIARQGIPVVDAWVRRTPGLDWTPPDGPGYGCIHLPRGTNDVALAERLHDEYGVLLVPGTLFEAPGTLRLSWLQAGSALETGLGRIATALQRRAALHVVS